MARRGLVTGGWGAGLLAMALLACGAQTARWRPAGDSESVAVEGDVTLRSTSDGRVEVTVVVRFHDQVGVGTATVLAARFDDARVARHRRLALARAWFTLAETNAGDPALAYEAAHAGLDVLGTDFVPRRVKDDTVFLVTLAEQKVAAQPAAEARELRDILLGRLRKYTVKWHAEVL